MRKFMNDQGKAAMFFLVVFLVGCEEPNNNFLIFEELDTQAEEEPAEVTSPDDGDGGVHEGVQDDTSSYVDDDPECVHDTHGQDDDSDQVPEDEDSDQVPEDDSADDATDICACDPDEKRCEVGTGLTGTYFKEDNLKKKVFKQLDEQISFDWGHDSPGKGIEDDGFSVRWEGKVRAPISGPVRFTVEYSNSREGLRLWVGRKRLIDVWKGAKSAAERTQVSAEVSLKEGKYYDVRLEYYDNKGEAAIELMWEFEDLAEDLIPRTCLYPSRHHRSLTIAEYEAVDEDLECSVLSVGKTNLDASVFSLLRRIL